MSTPALKYLTGYPADLLTQVQGLIDENRLADSLHRRYPQAHQVRTDRALYEYVGEIKATYMRKSEPLAKAQYDNTLHIVRHALGTHTSISRVQGGKLNAKREIRIAALFKDAPAAFLRMIVVHELAHFKEREHGKAFYSLCMHMEPDYHQLEFDVRLWLTTMELGSTS